MIRIDHLNKYFNKGKQNEIHVINDISLELPERGMVAVFGRSGCGKTTLLNVIGGLDRFSGGTLTVDGQNIREDTDTLRNREMGYIFQNYNLNKGESCYDNVADALRLLDFPEGWQMRERVEAALANVGMENFANRTPDTLSGGQQQRIAIARALATEPEVLLCDEATSALDPNTTHAILQLIREINRKLRITVIVITHQMSVVEEICDHVAILDNGTVVEEGTVGAVFSAPKSAAAKRLVFPNGADDAVCDPAKERRIRLVFNGADTTGAPLIATMAVKTGVLASIIAASTRSLDGQIYGTMLLGVPAGETARALEFLRGYADIYAEEVTG